MGWNIVETRQDMYVIFMYLMMVIHVDITITTETTSPIFPNLYIPQPPPTIQTQIKLLSKQYPNYKKHAHYQYIKNMLQEIHEGRHKRTYQLYIILLLIITLLIVPFQQIQVVLDYYKQYDEYMELLNRGPTQQYTQIDLNGLYPLLVRNPYYGVWVSSIKRSEFLEEEQGRIQVRTYFNETKDINNYDIKITIYDGWYMDDQHYDITINSGSLKVKQRYQPGKVLYQTVAPFISYYRDGEGFKVKSQKSLYINKIKLKVFSSSNQNSKPKNQNQLKLQILISSEYSINVVGKDIYQYQQTFHDFILSVVIVLQLIIQGYGIYHISEGILSSRENSLRYSRTGFLVSIGFDVSQAIVLSFIGFLSRKKIAVFSLPILVSWIIIIVIQLRILTILFHDQFRQNTIKFSAKIYSLFSLICIMSYLANFHPLYFIILSFFAMFPQIYNNYMVGHKLKHSMKHFMLYALPKYIVIPYIRLYRYNVFGFEPNFGVCMLCLVILCVQVMLIFLQVNYGVRSIVPKFLHPEELKYFLSQTDSEDDTCSICLVSIKQKAIVQPAELTELKQIRGEEIQNNIVLTPCRHKFHIECLAMSMKTKLECPNCRAILPPLEQYE